MTAQPDLLDQPPPDDGRLGTQTPTGLNGDTRNFATAAPSVLLRRPSSWVAVIALAHAGLAGLDRPVPEDASRVAATRVRRSLGQGERVEIDSHGDLVIHLRSVSRSEARKRVLSMSRAIAAYDARSEAGLVRFDVGAGVVLRRSEDSTVTAREHALRSLENRDLVPRPDTATLRLLRRWSKPSTLRTAGQVAAAVVLAWLVPFLVLVGFHGIGLDISSVVYLSLLAALVIMAIMQWAEALKALAPVELPPVPDEPTPPATAIIAAYLPNEADTIIETLEAFCALRYSGPLQVILAYNTPRDLPVEQELAEMARREPRLTLVRVPNSTSKSQNINHALPLVSGEFVGIFDADHHPATGAFERAWRWIGSGVDVVQGHCVIRNGDESRVSQLVATEFEQIYAVSHPGRQRLHGFGVFGGSNGFWQRAALLEIRFRTDFLTEDIEASIRAVKDGRRIVNDPGLLSRELAPTTVSGLWRQRMRWAQGWLQVAMRHAHSVTAEQLNPRQRFGMGMLLLWREVFPWFSSLMWPLLAFFVWRDGGLSTGASVLWLTTIFTLSTGPIQVLIARRLATPELRSRTAWWWAYGLANVLFYSEWKNLIARVAQMKQLMGEHEWVVTPRTSIRAVDRHTTSATNREVPA